MPETKEGVEIPEDVLFQPLGDEAVLLNLKDSRYYGLDDVGRRMWELLAEHRNPELVVQQLRCEYDAEETVLRRDLATFIEKLRAADLIAVRQP